MIMSACSERQYYVISDGRRDVGLALSTAIGAACSLLRLSGYCVRNTKPLLNQLPIHS